MSSRKKIKTEKTSTTRKKTRSTPSPGQIVFEHAILCRLIFGFLSFDAFDHLRRGHGRILRSSGAMFNHPTFLQTLDFQSSPVPTKPWKTLPPQAVELILRARPVIRKLTIRHVSIGPLLQAIVSLSSSSPSSYVMSRQWEVLDFPQLQVLDLQGCTDMNKRTALAPNPSKLTRERMLAWTVQLLSRTVNPVERIDMTSAPLIYKQPNDWRVIAVDGRAAFSLNGIGQRMFYPCQGECGRLLRWLSRVVHGEHDCQPSGLNGQTPCPCSLPIKFKHCTKCTPWQCNGYCKPCFDRNSVCRKCHNNLT